MLLKIKSFFQPNYFNKWLTLFIILGFSRSEFLYFPQGKQAKLINLALNILSKVPTMLIAWFRGAIFDRNHVSVSRKPKLKTSFLIKFCLKVSPRVNKQSLLTLPLSLSELGVRGKPGLYKVQTLDKTFGKPRFVQSTNQVFGNCR